ncbi:uncharacterized protein SOCE26_070620 [Sorangium cellulosum]|uniref:Uncharacterized protein n=1 Tax=Sorangium cellulosum TaxID=56 RepID=A0A2L0F1V4_SORCE|nr:hypothetical protein [Sorangium cellulosum]AUX45568.1 uncharacterized protein SOCE26_070620 [Sorangium cellulosum]
MALDKESAQVESRLQKVCEHFFGEDPELGPVLPVDLARARSLCEGPSRAAEPGPEDHAR